MALTVEFLASLLLLFMSCCYKTSLMALRFASVSRMLSMYVCFFPLKIHLHHSSKIKSHKEVKIVEIKVSLHFLLVDRRIQSRIRIRTKKLWIRIKEAQKHTDPDPAPEHRKSHKWPCCLFQEKRKTRECTPSNQHFWTNFSTSQSALRELRSKWEFFSYGNQCCDQIRI